MWSAGFLVVYILVFQSIILVCVARFGFCITPVSADGRAVKFASHARLVEIYPFRISPSRIWHARSASADAILLDWFFD